MPKNDPDLQSAINTLRNIRASEGLGKELYEAVSRLTPSVSVELIIKCPNENRTLLVWRDDGLYGPGWHIPGGVVRFKETMEARALLTLKNELGLANTKIPEPIGLHEIFNAQRDVRGHFLSIVFKIILDEPLNAKLESGPNPVEGHWKWFRNCPPNLIKNQEVLRGYI